MADLSFKNVGIGLAGSLLAGAISVTATTGVGASTAAHAAPGGSYVYTESNQTSADGGNSVLAFGVGSGGTLASIGSFPSGGDGTGAGLGSQGAVTIADSGRALLAVNAASNTVSYFRILSNGTLSLVDAAPSGGSDPVSVAAHGTLGRRAQPGQQHGGLACPDRPRADSVLAPAGRAVIGGSHAGTDRVHSFGSARHRHGEGEQQH